MKTQLSLFDNVRYISLKNDVYIGRSLQIYGEWSYGEIDVIKKVLPNGGNVMEVGSNIGAHSVHLARDVCGKDGFLFAFEPRRILFQLLCANLTLNNIENANCFRVALGEKSEVFMEGAINTDGDTNAGGHQLHAIQGNDEQILVTTVDNVLDSLPTIHVLKADIEGYELKMLKGGEQLIERDRPILYLENDRIPQSPELLSHIAERGYEIFWHTVPLFRKNNIAGTTLDIFGGIISANILCLPVERVGEDIDTAALMASIPRLTPCTDINKHPYKPS